MGPFSFKIRLLLTYISIILEHIAIRRLDSNGHQYILFLGYIVKINVLQALLNERATTKPNGFSNSLLQLVHWENLDPKR